MPSGKDIAIVGAGPAGLAAAIYLRRDGHRVTIFERFDTAKPLGSGLILQPTGLTVLHDLGLLTQMLALGSRVDRLYGAEAETGRPVLDVRYARGGRFGLAVHRSALFCVLHAAAVEAGIAVETGMEIDDLDAGADAVSIVAAGRKRGRFDLVVDANGARSALRRLADASSEPHALAYGAFWASLAWPEGSAFDRHALLQRYRRASVMIGVLPIGRAEPGAPAMAAFFWSLKPADVDAVRAAGIAAWKQRVLALWPECEGFTRQIDGFETLTLARYGHHTLIRPVGHRLAVIGDAAHSTSPQLGQGANMALLDARALAVALRRSDDVDSALEAYAAMRRWHVRVFQTLSHAFTPFYQSDSRVLPFVRDRLMPALAKVPPAPRFLASMVAGTLVDPFRALGLRELDWDSVPEACAEP
ncbi:MAG: FAD-dependent oxidoreductase [Rhizobiaceae bacterium]